MNRVAQRRVCGGTMARPPRAVLRTPIGPRDRLALRARPSVGERGEKGRRADLPQRVACERDDRRIDLQTRRRSQAAGRPGRRRGVSRARGTLDSAFPLGDASARLSRSSGPRTRKPSSQDELLRWTRARDGNPRIGAADECRRWPWCQAMAGPLTFRSPRYCIRPSSHPSPMKFDPSTSARCLRCAPTGPSQTGVLRLQNPCAKNRSSVVDA